MSSPSQRSKELLDQKKNWIFNDSTPNSTSDSAEEAMGVRSYDPAGSRASRNGLTSFLNSRETRPSAATLTPLEQGKSDSPVLFDSSSETGFRPNALFGTLATADPFRQGAARSALPGVPGVLSSPVPQASTPLYANPQLDPTANPLNMDFRHVTVSVQDLLRPGNKADPLKAIYDPINLRVDTTRQEINPITSRRVLDLPLERRGDLAGPLPTGTQAKDYSRPTLLDAMSAKIQGPSSLAPTYTTPSASANDSLRPPTLTRIPGARF